MRTWRRANSTHQGHIPGSNPKLKSRGVTPFVIVLTFSKQTIVSTDNDPKRYSYKRLQFAITFKVITKISPQTSGGQQSKNLKLKKRPRRDVRAVLWKRFGEHGGVQGEAGHASSGRLSFF